jgi:hypothetical protein
LLGITIGEDTNTQIIIDDIVSHGADADTSLGYMECQLKVCRAYWLSLSMKKSFIFPKQFSFVGNNVCPDGKRPAQSKHDLLSTWPRSKTVCNVAKFIGFAQFYSVYVHPFELCILYLRKLTTKHKYTEIVALHWMDDAKKAFQDIQQAILSNPCLMRFNHQQLVAIRTDFSLVGFAFVICQPAMDTASKAAMIAYCTGKNFFSMTKDSSPVLQPVAFGGQRCCGNKTCLHSHLGKGFSGDWAINKN